MTVAPAGSQDDVKVFIHFGYLGAFAAISPRVTNESAFAAKAANAFYGQGQAPTASCPTEALRSCLIDSPARQWLYGFKEMRRNISVSPHLFALNYCMQQACPDRAKALAPLFKDFYSSTYVAAKDFEVPYTSGRYMVPKGTKVLGRMLSGPSSSDAEKERTRLTAIGRIPLRVVSTGKPAYLNGTLTLDAPAPELFTEQP